jgi:hypothetical protein
VFAFALLAIEVSVSAHLLVQLRPVVNPRGGPTKNIVKVLKDVAAIGYANAAIEKHSQ